MKKKIVCLTGAILICMLLSTCGFATERSDAEKVVAKETVEVSSKEITEPEELTKAKNYSLNQPALSKTQYNRTMSLKSIGLHGILQYVVLCLS